MYCRNCGEQIDSNAAICVKCGFAKGTGVKYCANCDNTPNINPETQKSKMTAGLLGIFLGGLGIHNFYLGYTGKAIAQIALSICFGAGAIWGLIERIMILTGKINKDANGVPLKE